MVMVDGAYGEGGGQILRGAVALSCVTGKSVTVFNIRGRRPKPGIQPQHLMGIEAAAAISGAEVEGAEIGSLDLTFRPKELRGGERTFDIKTAGSVTLVAQTIIPPLAFADRPSEVRIIGGTDVPWSPPADYFRHVFIPAIRAFGVDASMEVKRRGHYPRGGGEVVLRVSPVRALSPVRSIERGMVQAVRGVSFCTNLPSHVASRQAASAERILKAGGYANVRIASEALSEAGGSPGSGIALWAETGGAFRVGADAMGAREKRAEEVGAEAANKLTGELHSGMACDRHLADMIIIYMALAEGNSEVGVSSLTMHARTMIWLTKLFTGAQWAEGATAGAATIAAKGAGVRSRSL